MNIFLILLGILVILYLLALAYVCVKKVSKKQITDAYNISDKTFLKWLNQLMPNYVTKWKLSIGGVSLADKWLIEKTLGDPETLSAMNRAEIIAEIKKDQNLPKADYRFLRENLLGSNLPIQLIGLSTFPPKAAQWLLMLAKGEPNAQSFSTL